MKRIEILGTGCPKCRELADHAESAAKGLGIEYELIKITDINEILRYGVMMTPALAVDGDVKCVGKVMSVDDIKEALAGGCQS